MYNYFCLKFKSEEQWLEVNKVFELSKSRLYEIDAFGAVSYEESYVGTKSTAFHVNIATVKTSLPDKLMAFVVKPQRIKRTFNGAGLHEEVDKKDFEKIPDEKVTGFEVTLAEVKNFSKTETPLKDIKNNA